MRRVAPALFALALCGCPPKVPEHLRVVTQEDTKAAALEFESRDAMLDALVGRDPLVRAPALPDAEHARTHDEGIAAWIEEVKALEEGDGDPGPLMLQLAERFPESEVVALSRGYRLRRAENRVGNLTGSDEGELGADLARLLTPLRDGGVMEGMTRSPLPFLGTDAAKGMRVYGERWVLSAWLVSPKLHTAPVTQALAAPQYDGLSSSPTGRILANRDKRADVPQPALDDLRRATLLSLTRAAADRDKEQAAWAELKHAAREELGVKEPEQALLQRAFDGLSASTGADAAAAGAWIAATGLRWLDACPDAPCVGYDRTAVFSDATRWGPEVSGLAHAWRVIALKDALDTMEAGHDTVLFPTAILQLADALNGTGAGPIDMAIVRKARPDPAVWLGLARAVGADGATDWSTTRTALGSHLETVAKAAIEANPDNELTPLLERIAKRAVR
ncbi:MAG: hypothetical protein H6737_15585 [Alphaproteobacteria bacterium]|nr:hypothetical protein [Alphaproteobacteria bacterium]